MVNPLLISKPVALPFILKAAASIDATYFGLKLKK
jgi:hypothetical protein